MSAPQIGVRQEPTPAAAPGAPHEDAALRRGVLRSTTSNIVSRLYALGTWVFLTPFMVDHLGPAEYGLWALIGSISAYGSLFDLGISASVVKFVAEHRVRREVEELRALIATCLGLFLVIGAIVALVGAVLAPFIPNIFNVPAADRGTASWTIVAAGASTGLALPASMPNAVLSGLQRFDLVAAGTIASMSLFAASTVVVLLLGGGLVAIVLSGIPISLFSMALAAWFARRVAPEVRIGLRGFDRRIVRRVGSFSSATFVLEASGYLQGKTDEIVIGAALPVASVGPYSVARRLSDLPQMLTWQFSGVLMPLASQLDAQGSRRRVQALLVTGTRVAIAGFLPIGLGLMILGGPFLRAWIGPTFGGASEILVVLTGAAVISTLLGPSVLILLGTNRHRMVAVIAVGAGLLNLGLSIALIHVYGTLGVALGTLIATALLGSVVLPYSARIHGIGARTALTSVLGPAGLPALPAILTLYLLREAFEPTSIPSVLLVGAAGGLVYVGIYLLMPICTGERELLRHGTARLRELRRTSS